MSGQGSPSRRVKDKLIGARSYSSLPHLRRTRPTSTVGRKVLNPDKRSFPTHKERHAAMLRKKTEELLKKAAGEQNAVSRSLSSSLFWPLTKIFTGSNG
jgi:hypothetical protein